MIKNADFSYKDTPVYERMKKFLLSYKACKNACEALENERECGIVSAVGAEYRDAFLAECRHRCKMIEDFIQSADFDRDERQLFWLHYVEGLSIEKASEAMYVSRSTVFRINKRAEGKAFTRFMSLESVERKNIC